MTEEQSTSTRDQDELDLLGDQDAQRGEGEPWYPLAAQDPMAAQDGEDAEDAEDEAAIDLSAIELARVTLESVVDGTDMLDHQPDLMPEEEAITTRMSLALAIGDDLPEESRPAVDSPGTGLPDDEV